MRLVDFIQFLSIIGGLLFMYLYVLSPFALLALLFYRWCVGIHNVVSLVYLGGSFGSICNRLYISFLEGRFASRPPRESTQERACGKHRSFARALAPVGLIAIRWHSPESKNVADWFYRLGVAAARSSASSHPNAYL